MNPAFLIGAPGRAEADRMYFGILDIVIVFMLIILNGMFAMSEVAMISARKARLQQSAEEGDEKARAALELAGNPQRFLSTTQIGITLISILSGAFGGASLARLLSVRLAGIPYIAKYNDTISLIVVVAVITYFSLIIGELIPKRVALAWPESIARVVARPMEIMSRVASPVIPLLTVSTEFLLKVFGFRPTTEPPVTEEEIRVLISQATVAGVFEESEQKMVERVFRLGDRRVGAMMTPRNKIAWLDLNGSAEKTRRKIARTHFSRFPVCYGRLGNLTGMLHIRDIARRCLNGQPLDLRASMKKPLYVHESMHGLKVLELFRESGTQIAVVIDEYGTIEGLVTMSDILEAIVGDIPSVEDLEEPRIVQRDDGSWLIDGMLPIDELKAHLHIRILPAERAGGYQSLGGFVMTFLQRIPSMGDRFECCGYRFEVLDMDRRRVGKVLVQRTEDPSQQEDSAEKES